VSHHPDFDLFRPTDDHEELRAAVRLVAENKIAPYAAEVDRTASFPQEAHDALVASDFRRSTTASVPTRWRRRSSWRRWRGSARPRP